MTTLPRILRETPEEHAASLARLREAMAAYPFADVLGPLDDSELMELIVRLEPASARPDAEPGTRQELIHVLSDAYLARDRIWGEI
jgi:hypothetical protein